MAEQDEKDDATLASDDGAVGEAGGEAAPGADGEAADAAAAHEHEPVTCPSAECGAPPGTSWPWASDQAALIHIAGKCLGCLMQAGELTEDIKNRAIAEAHTRGVSPEQQMEMQEVEIGTAILMRLDAMEQHQKREGFILRMAVGCLIRMQTGGKAELPEFVVKMLGINVEDMEAEARKASLSVDIPSNFNPNRLKTH